jgi:hypothetical protein
MTLERYIRLIAGSLVLAGLALGNWVSPYWYLFTAFAPDGGHSAEIGCEKIIERRSFARAVDPSAGSGKGRCGAVSESIMAVEERLRLPVRRACRCLFLGLRGETQLLRYLWDTASRTFSRWPAGNGFAAACSMVKRSFCPLLRSTG